MTPQDRYLQALEELRRAESAARRCPTAGNLALVRAAADRAQTAYRAVPSAPKPASIGRLPRPLALARTELPARRSRAYDWQRRERGEGDHGRRRST